MTISQSMLERLEIYAGRFFTGFIQASVCVTIILAIHCFIDETLIVNRKRILGCVFLITTDAVLAQIGIHPLVFFYVQFFSEEQLFDETSVVRAGYLFLANITGYLYTFLFPSLQKKSGVKKTVIRMGAVIGLYIIILSLIENLVAIIYIFAGDEAFLLKKPADYQIKEWLIDLFLSLSISLLILCSIYFAFFRKRKVIRMKLLDIIAFVIYLVILGIIGEALSFMLEKEELFTAVESKQRVFVLLLILILVLFFPVLIVINRIRSSYKELADHQQNFLEIELNASKQYKAAQAETRSFRHDIQNNLTVVTTLMQDGRINEAESYLNDMRSKINSLSPKVVSGDDMVDSLILSKLAKMSENGITFSMDGVIDGGLDWKPMDICTVFANMIDNAIEAASKTENGFIRMEFKKSGQKRLIRAFNSCAEDVDCERILAGGGHITSKKDKTLHGYGISNIRRTVEKYGGMMQISCAEKIFTMDIVLMN